MGVAIDAGLEAYGNNAIRPISHSQTPVWGHHRVVRSLVGHANGGTLVAAHRSGTAPFLRLRSATPVLSVLRLRCRYAQNERERSRSS